MASQIVLLSGPPHSGKSAVADALCARYDRMARVDVCALRDVIRMGRLRPWDDSADGRRQRELLVSIACDIASRFVDAGYGVIIEAVATPDDVRAYAHWLKDVRSPVHIVTLLPDLGSVLDRERERPTEWGRGPGRLEKVHKSIASMQEFPIIDPDQKTETEVADRVMELAAGGSARLLLEGEEADDERADN